MMPKAHRKRGGRALTGLAIGFGLGFSYILLELGSAVILRYFVAVHQEAIPPSESGLTFFRPTQGPLPFTIVPHFHQIYRSAEFTTDVLTNNRGFREPADYHGEMPDVTVMGDSFTFGMGVQEPERYSSQLASQMRQWRVINTSWPNGNFPVNYYLFLKLYPELLPRRHLVIGLYLGNDLLPDYAAQTIAWGADGLATSASFRPPPPRGSRHLPEGWRERLSPYLTQLSRSPIFQLSHVLWGRYQTHRYIKPGVSARRIVSLPEEEHGNLTPTTKLVLNHIAAAAQMAKKRRAKTTVLVIPELHRLFPNHPFCPYTPALCQKRASESKLIGALSSYLKDRGVAVVDPSPELRRLGAAAYFHWDGHWTAPGHAAAAEKLLAVLKR